MKWDLTARCAARICAIICYLILAGLPALARVPEPPVNSDLAFRILPSRYDGNFALPPQVMKEQPLVRLAAEFLFQEIGLDLVDLLDGAFEGTMVGAILSDPKAGSNLGKVLQDSELRSQRDSVVSDLRALASDLEGYKSENETYPEDFRKFIDEYRYYEPYLPEGVSYQYRQTESGQGFELAVSFKPPSLLGKLGPAPIFRNGYEEQHAEAEEPAPPLNAVLALKVADAQKVRTLIDKLFGKATDGFWSLDGEGVVTLRGDWLVASDRKRNIGPFLKALNGQAPGLSKRANYSVVARNLDMNAPFSLYADLPRIISSLDLTDDPELRRLLELVGPAGYSVTLYDRSEFRMEAFMAVRAPKGSELEKILAESRDAQTESSMVAGNIPWDVSHAFALDYRRSKRLLDALVDLSPEARQSMDMVEDVWAGFLGLDAEAGFDRLADGWVVLSLERLDILVNAFEGFTDAMSAVGELPNPIEETGGPISEEAMPVDSPAESTEVSGADEGAESGELSPGDPLTPQATPDLAQGDPVPAQEDPVSAQEGPAPAQDAPDRPSPETGEPVFLPSDPSAPAKPPRLPFTVAFQVPDAQARAALLEALSKQLGDNASTQDLYGVEVKGRKDGLLSYAQVDDWFYVSGGNTQRLLRNLLAAAKGRKSALTSLDSWSRFRAGQRGEVLAISHQKVDAGYSMLKGFLLFMGPDFRPLAEELGGLRDSHGAMFLVPDGVLCVGDMLQGGR